MFVCWTLRSQAGTTIRSSLPTKICPIDPWQLPPAMIVGNIGSEKNLEYTCIGDTVNYSSRLEGINKMYGTDIIINVFTKKNVEHDLLLWKLDTIQVKGRAQGSQIFEVMAEKKNAPQEQIRIKSDLKPHWYYTEKAISSRQEKHLFLCLMLIMIFQVKICQNGAENILILLLRTGWE